MMNTEDYYYKLLSQTHTTIKFANCFILEWIIEKNVINLKS